MNLELVLAILLGVSEVLALIPQLKENSILQLVGSLLKKLIKKDEVK